MTDETLKAYMDLFQRSPEMKPADLAFDGGYMHDKPTFGEPDVFGYGLHGKRALQNDAALALCFRSVIEWLMRESDERTDGFGFVRLIEIDEMFECEIGWEGGMRAFESGKLDLALIGAANAVLDAKETP